jgi:hypothetical protein
MRKFSSVLAALLMVGLLGFTPRASASPMNLGRFVVKATPTDEKIAKGVLKALGALVAHKASQPQKDDGFVEGLLRAAAVVTRDKLIDSVLEDVFPDAKAVERDSIRNLAVLALDGKLSQDRDTVHARLKKTNPDMADAVQVAEFLIRLAKAADKTR